MRILNDRRDNKSTDKLQLRTFKNTKIQKKSVICWKMNGTRRHTINQNKPDTVSNTLLLVKAE